MRKTSRKLISYIRVSTDKQGESGLGLEAQQAAVESYRQSAGCELVAEYREVESGTDSDRPELARAFAHARRIGARIVFAKLDRLSRNARFLLGIVESGADVVFCDFPTIPAGAAGKYMLTNMAAASELEAGLISERTKAALAAAKARGVALGGHRDGAHVFTDADRAKAGARAAATHRQAATDAYSDLVDEMKGLRAGGMSLRAIADQLNADGHTTRTGAVWTAVQVKRVLDREADAS